MNKLSIRLLVLSITIGLCFTGGGCGHRSVTRISTSNPDRKMSAAFDMPASYKVEGGDSVLSFGDHKLVVMKEWLILDGGKGKFGISEKARKIEIQVKRDILTMSADGNDLIKTPI